MTVMIAEVYDALRSAGADDEKARKAAEAVAEMKKIEAGLSSEMHGVKLDVQGIRGEIATLKWMNGGLVAVAVAILSACFSAERL